MFKRLSNKQWYIQDRLSESMMNQLKYIVDNLDRNSKKMGVHLAGQIEDEYSIIYPTDIWYYIKKLIVSNQENINSFESKPKDYNNFELTDRTHKDGNEPHSWVNFQKKYEYNPIHNHSGDFSFVIWYRIPYKKSDEIKIGPGTTRNNTNGSFSFVYSRDNGMTRSELITGDTSLEGTILIFPANLNHLVYPFFSSTKERISFSGNVFLEIKQKSKTTLL